MPLNGLLKLMVWSALVTLNTLLTALLKPLALAVNCLLVPAEPTCKLVKLTRPLPALVPMSMIPPRKGPEPLVSVSVTLLLEPRPTAESFPNWSRVRRMG